MLTDHNIERIAREVAQACQAEMDSAGVKRVKAAIQEADTSIENLWKALEQGSSVDKIMERINKREAEKAELEAQLAIEMKRLVILTEPQIHLFLKKLQASDMNDSKDRQSLINIFVREIYLKDDRFTMILNGSGQPVEVSDILLEDIEAAFGESPSDEGDSSSLVADAPARRGSLRPCHNTDSCRAGRRR